MRCESQWKTPAWEIMPKRLIGCKGTHYFIKKKTPGRNGKLAGRNGMLAGRNGMLVGRNGMRPSTMEESALSGP